MTSSMATGERRWASARRGGMTVLGRVAVPKPINLPSQRLENHGLDPNVEIVPKGTLSWGSRPSSSGSNAWGTSALSPSTDGSSSSPSHLVGRPASSGGTRPSTAGSERTHDSNGNAWGSNSRPSSASGVLASNHASLSSLRPHSAETRPGSSHLSRFAEPSPEGSGAWGATTASELMEVATSVNEGFSLSSGDFPTLGSEKDESKRNMNSLDHTSHGRPGSSGGVTTQADSTGIAHGDDVSQKADVKGNSWRKDGTPCVEDGPRPGMERRHGEPHLYPNPNMTPPRYESWHGAPPVNPPGGFWFRGPPGPPPYGGPVPPGSFPMEPFPYYHPQVLAPGLANSQPIPPPRPGHHGHHLKNGDMPHMPHMPHLRPGIPLRPGFCPGPVPYDGYYRPPSGFCNPNERDLPFMEMAAGPVYNRHANQNASDLNNSYPRLCEGRGPDHAEPGHPHDPLGQHKVLVKPNDGWNQNNQEKWAHSVNTNVSNCVKGILSKASSQESALVDDCKKYEDIQFGKRATVKEVSSQSFENKLAPMDAANEKFPGRVTNVDEVEMSRAIDSVGDHSLIQKIEGLNAKARVSGGRQDGLYRENQRERVQFVNAKASQSVNEANSDVFERPPPTGVLVPVSRDIDVVTAEKNRESTVTAAPRRIVHGAQSRGNPNGKGKFHGQEVSGWGKNSESHSVVPEAGLRSTNIDQVAEHYAAVQPAEESKPNIERKGDGGFVMSGYDPSDTQRAKMRETIKQRAIQLQKEEEERIREQKAKALAKLEELNRRSANHGTENPSQKETALPHNAVPEKQDDSRNLSEPSWESKRSTGSSSAFSNNVAQINETSAKKTVKSGVLSRNLVDETKRNAYEDPISSLNQLPTADINLDDAAGHRTAPQVHEVTKQRRVVYRQRQNVPTEKNLTLDSIPVGGTQVLKDLKDKSSTQEVTGSEVDSGAGKEPAESPLTSDSSVHPKKKNNKGEKNRHKVAESCIAVSSSGELTKDSILGQVIPKSAEHNASNLHVNSTSIQLSADAKDATQSTKNYSSLSREDAHGRVNNASKPQHSRKPRNSLGNRSSEKSHSNDAVVWTPVRLHDKVEVTDQTSQRSAEPLVSSATGDNVVHNSSKIKRAEMERYVPKPVAKELAQQGSIERSVSPLIDQTTDGTGGREKASLASENVMKAGATAEVKRVDGKDRHPKAQGSWRQRVSVESTPAQASQDASSSAANPVRSIQMSYGSQQTVISDESLVREPPSRSDEYMEKRPQAGISDGWSWDSANDSNSNSAAAFTGVKDQIPSGRAKRRPYKGHKGNGNNQNFNHEDSNAGSTVLQCPVETIQTEKITSSKETRAVGDRSTSHWQPKSQGYVPHNQQGNRSRGGQSFIAEDGKALKRETGPDGDSRSSAQQNQSAAKDWVPASGGKNVAEAMPRMVHQETKREKRAAPVKGRPYSPSQGPASKVEPDPFVATDGHNEHRPSSGYRKNASYTGRFNSGLDSRGEWISAAQENKQHHFSSANQERHRQNSHYEYQPVGQSNSSSRSNESATQTENQPGGPRFRERGHGHARRGRGDFYGRQSSNE